MDSDPDLIQVIVLVLALIIIHGIFASGEVLVVDRRRKNEEQIKDSGKKRLTKIFSEPSKIIASLEAGKTITALMAFALFILYIFPVMTDYLNTSKYAYGNGIASLVSLFLFTFILLVIGSYLPKRIVLHYQKGLSNVMIYPLLILVKILIPFVTLVQGTTSLLSNLFGIKTAQIEEKITMEEIHSIIDGGEEQGIINFLEKKMIDSVILFDRKNAEDVMTARTEVFMIDVESPIEEYVGEMLELKYSRIPVYEGDIDNIIGILYVKDYLVHAYQYGFTKVNLRKLIRPAHFIPERKGVDELFLELQEINQHMAILIDEYGGFSGVVTMEDILEEIVGDIDDEYDHDEPDIRIIDANNFYARGSVSIRELNEKIGSNFDESSDDYDTLGGLLIKEIGYIPEDDTLKKIEIDDVRFTIHRILDKRIMTVKIELLNRLEEE